MKTEVVKCHEVVNGVKSFIGEGNLQIAESLEDMIEMTEKGECVEENMVTLFNASRRIEFQRKLKAGSNGKVSAKTTLNKIEAAAKTNPELAALLKSFGLNA